MNDQKSRVLDDMGRIVLPRKLTSQLGWQPGTRLTAIVNLRNKTIELFSKADGGLQMDEFGILALPQGFRKAFGWGYRDKLGVTVNTEEGTISLALDTKFVPKCVFCGKQEEAISINDISVCRKHMITIAKWSALDKLRDTTRN